MKLDKKIVIALGLQFGIYLLQYVVIPMVYKPMPNDEWEPLFVILISTVIVVLIGQYIGINKIYMWLLSIPLYPLLVKVYHPEYIYAIGYDSGFFDFRKFENFMILYYTAFVLLFEVCTCSVIFIKRSLTELRKRRRGNE